MDAASEPVDSVRRSTVFQHPHLAPSEMSSTVSFKLTWWKSQAALSIKLWRCTAVLSSVAVSAVFRSTERQTFE